MMGEGLTTILISVATTGVGGFFGWLFGKKEADVRIKGEEVSNFDKSLDAYKKMYEDMIGDLKDQNADLKQEVNELKQELAENRKQVMTLTNFVLASAVRRADASLDEDTMMKLKAIINEKG